MPTDLVKRLELRGALSDDERDALHRVFLRYRDIPRNSDAFHEGDPLGGCTVLLQGLAYRYKSLAGGGRQIVSYLLPGDIVSSGMETGNAFDHSVHVVTPTRMSTVHIGELDELGPKLMRSLWSFMSRELSISWEWLANVGRRDARTRIAHLFCELYHRMKEIGLVEGGAFVFPASQQEIADSVGLTSVHVNRTVQRLRSEGVIKVAKQIVTVPDIAALEKISMFDPSYLHLMGPAENPAASPAHA